MPSDTNRRFHLASRPTDLPSDAHFRIETAPIPTPESGEVLVRVLIAALSPWQGQRLKDFENYTKPFAIGELIDCDVLGQVVGGDALLNGDLVTGRLGWQEYALARPEDLLPASPEFDETLWLTALSSPGLTAYCAMEMFGRPMPGQTLVVTSAAGSVGSYAVQLGKLAGMKVVGVAGGPEKCAVVTETTGRGRLPRSPRSGPLRSSPSRLAPKACTCSSIRSADGSATPSSRDWRSLRRY